MKVSNGERLPKLYLLRTIADTHGLFLFEQPHVRHIQLTKFSSLKPEHVLIYSKLPQTTCVCEKLENIRFLLNILSMYTDLPKSTDFIAQALTCNDNSE